MRVKLAEEDKKTWATEIRLLLFTHGFGFVWGNQGVQLIGSFLKVFKQRLVDCRAQDWYTIQCNTIQYDTIQYNKLQCNRPTTLLSHNKEPEI